MPKPAESQAQTLSAHKKPTATLTQNHWPLSRWLVIAAVLIVLDPVSYTHLTLPTNREV